MKCFSFKSHKPVSFYNEEVVPLLRRMPNLEQLTLYLSIIEDDLRYIDGNRLSDEVLIHMPRLNKFIFSIDTWCRNMNNNINYPSNDDILRSFIGKSIYHQVDSYTRKAPMVKDGRCHIYSLPYQFHMFHSLNNSFSGGMFETVVWLEMADIRSFEHDFFKLISQCFPLLRKLTVRNHQQQQAKQHSSTSFTFPHLTTLSVKHADTDYAGQFLFNRKVCVPNLLHLHIQYESLAMITNNFTNDTIRLNCAQLRSVSIVEPFVRPENFDLYFPQL
jgi:hypothetical protein